MAERIGKSRSSVTETFSLASMPAEIRQLCRRADIDSKSLLLQIVRQADPQKMAALIGRLEKEGSTRQTARRVVKEEQKASGKGRPRNYVFRYAPREKGFALALRFKKSQVPREEIVRTLQAILAELTAAN
jgi:ParB family chromosome partitioning protein